MGEQVKVADIQTIERFRATYATVVESFGLALQDAESDVDRTALWLENDMTSYWQRELRKGQDQVVMCKSALFRKQEIKSTPEARPSVVSEKKALDKAKRRVALCEDKLKSVRRWKNELPRQAIIFKGALAPMATMLDRDAPKILAMLRRMTEHLEEYLRTNPDETERLLAILGEISVARGGEESEGEAKEGDAKEGEATEPAQPDAERNEGEHA